MILMQKVTYGNPENALCDQNKVDLLDEEVKRGLKGSHNTPIYHQLILLNLLRSIIVCNY